MTKDNPTIATLKLWVFPSIVSVLALMIWNDVNEIKSDVKALMAQSNIDKTRIDNLERNLYKTSTSGKLPIAPTEEQQPIIIRVVDNREFAYIKLKQK